MPRTSRLLLIALLALPGCTGGGTEAADVLDRQLFVDTYVDLRVTAVRSEEGELDEAQRAAVLARHGVTEEDLLEFARVHGPDVDFMRDVWNDIEDRLDEELLEPANTG